MNLPTREDQDMVLAERPGDDLYPQAKEAIGDVMDNTAKLKQKLEKLVLGDMSLDLAVSDAMDKVGLVLNYLPQEQGKDINSPEFDGIQMMEDFSRIAKLKLSLDYANILGLDECAMDAVLKAEVGRLWGEPGSALLKRLLVNKARGTSKTAQEMPKPYKNPKKAAKDDD